VRVCGEVQSVGALEFAYRGAAAKVVTSFNKPMAEIECVNCGQCVKVCPVGALTPKYQIAEVWNAINDPTKTVVAQIAPAVRVALGEYFGQKPGTISTGKMVSALRRMGFSKVYDTCFGADFTVVEEGKEFLERLSKNENLPQFTSCCPAWVKFAEQYYPDLLSNLSTCGSPQQMFGALAKDILAKKLGVSREDLVVVSIMPCTAKKFEARRSQFKVNGNPDVDHVLTTKELSLMIAENGMDFEKLDLSSFDMPFGFSTGGAVIFGTSGGVSEAVLRFASETLQKGSAKEFKQFRYNDDIRVAEVAVGGKTLSLCVVSGLKNAKTVIDKVRKGELHYDLIEVMACPGGCVNGGGQPSVMDNRASVRERSKGLYDNDRMLQFHVSSENPHLREIYKEELSPEKSHELLHTTYENRQRIQQEDFVINETPGEKKLSLSVCFGTSCFLRGSQELYKELTEFIRTSSLEDVTEFKANFCGKMCKKGPVVKINDVTLENCSLELAKNEIRKILSR
jgi:NADH-quinone oxidoreductase subunit G